MTPQQLQILASSLRGVLRSLSHDELRELGHEVAQVLYAAPPGVDRVEFLRGLLDRRDAGTTTYADQIILDACSRPEVLRPVERALSMQRARR